MHSKQKPYDAESTCGLTDFVICLSVSSKNAALLMHHKRDLIWNGWKVYGIKEFKEMNIVDELFNILNAFQSLCIDLQ